MHITMLLFESLYFLNIFRLLLTTPRSNSDQQINTFTHMTQKYKYAISLSKFHTFKRW